MATPEELVNIEVRHQVLLERLKSGFYRPFNQALNKLDKEAVAAILFLDVQKISELSKRDLGVLIADLRTLSMDLLDGQVDDFIDDLRKLSTQEAAFEVGAIEAVAENVKLETPPRGSPYTYANNRPGSTQGLDGRRDDSRDGSTGQGYNRCEVQRRLHPPGQEESRGGSQNGNPAFQLGIAGKGLEG